VKIVLTGAAGGIGSALRAPLRERAELVRLVDTEQVDDVVEGEDALDLDLADLEGLRRAFREMDAVVHLAAVPSETAFDAISEANLRGAFHVFEAARLEGVRRVVFASSNHVTGFYGRDDTITPSSAPRPDTLYGASKVFGEALGSLYADKFGLEVVCLRIGAYEPEPPEGPTRPMWLSPGDMARLTVAALTAPNIRFHVVYGLSRTGSTWWANDEAAAAIGYRPEDAIDPREPRPGFQGDPFTARDYHGAGADD
jgi:uronate dehydrogenase